MKYFGFYCVLGFCLILNVARAEVEFDLKMFGLYEVKGDSLLIGNLTQQPYPIGINKLMLALITLEDIRSNSLDWNNAILTSKDTNFGNKPLLYIPEKTRLTTQDLLGLLFLSCANNVAQALSTLIDKDKSKLITRMNQRAKQLGMVNTKFNDIEGATDGNSTTINDITILARYIYMNFPLNRYFYNKKNVKYAGLRFSNTNGMLWKNNGVDGMLSCATIENKRLLIATTRNETSIFMLVAFGDQSYDIFLRDATELLDEAVRNFYTYQLFAKGEVMRTIPIYGGKRKSVNLGPNQDIYYTVQNDEHCCKASNITVSLSYPKYLRSPVETDSQQGIISLRLPDRELKQYPLTVSESIKNGNILSRMSDMIKLAFTF
ncbi:MAG: hypothetical protein QM538_06040 [Methylacidiphilales bacterium]|nr:hypothetical protein [Candidatus Methylacidiphilales bacterium]